MSNDEPIYDRDQAAARPAPKKEEPTKSLVTPPKPHTESAAKPSEHATAPSKK